MLILSPTRELAQQTEKVISAVGDYLNVQAHACIGGKSLGERAHKGHRWLGLINALISVPVFMRPVGMGDVAQNVDEACRHEVLVVV